MVIVTVKTTPKSEFKNEFLQEFNKVASSVRKEDGCIEYEIFQKTPEGLEFFIFERWESQEALDAHLKTSHMSEYFTRTENWFDSEKELKIYQVIS